MFGGFEGYLISKAALNEKYIPYYLKWVSYCYSFLDQPDNSLLTSEQVQSYLNHISKTREDWQVKQAEAALRHYGYYLSSELETLEESVESGLPAEIKDLWTALEKKARDQLHLRHRSYSTEKTYLSWLRAFGDHVNWKTPECPRREKSAGRLRPCKKTGYRQLVSSSPPDNMIRRMTFSSSYDLNKGGVKASSVPLLEQV